jgi:hydrogenase maturation protein HypF
MKNMTADEISSYIKLPFSFKDSVLATGSEFKSSFAVLIKDTIFISRVFDDLGNPHVFESYKRAILNTKRKLGIKPDIIGCDLHPEYVSTKYAKEFFEEFGQSKEKFYSPIDAYRRQNTDLQHPTFVRTYLLEIQHHHAHIASCMAENGLDRKVIGVAFDGTGYGTDGKIWGGEFLVANYCNFDRMAHLAYVPMPGADKSVIEPVRMAFSYLHKTYKKRISSLKLNILRRIGREKISLFTEMINKGINSPLTSSAGRLFDAVSSLLGIRDCISYAGEAAIELEKIAATATDCKDTYKFRLVTARNRTIIEFWPVIKAIVSDLKDKRTSNLISRKFHNTLAEAIKEVCLVLRRKTGLNDIVLSGGVFQNKILSKEVERRLKDSHFSIYLHSKTSCADKDLALGQAVIAAHKAHVKK